MLRDPSMRKLVSVPLVILSVVLTIGTSALHAAESDLWTTTAGPIEIIQGVPFTMVVGYGNNGPETAGSAYPNHYFVPPIGLDVFVDNTVNGDGSLYAELAASADGTDTLGNAPLLFWDDNNCEEVLFQVQRNDDDDEANPVEGLDPGVGSTFSYETMIPMTDPAMSVVTITEPVSITQSWHGITTSVLDASSKNGFSRGGCEKLVGGDEEDICSYIADNCFGARVSQLDVPLDAEFELVNDGTADPTLGCEEFVGFTPGNVAVLRRGDCQFGAKASNAEQAGASAVFMVNSNLCGDFPDSDQCVLGMLAGDLGALTTIPTIQVAQADGEPVISALEGGATVLGRYGDTSIFTGQSTIFLADVLDTDPDETNNDSLIRIPVCTAGCPVFTDGFESGETTNWDATSP